jgi:hypothetical protein
VPPKAFAVLCALAEQPGKLTKKDGEVLGYPAEALMLARDWDGAQTQLDRARELLEQASRQGR